MDSSWDNSSAVHPKKKWKYRGAFFTASIVTISILVFCSVWVLWFSKNEVQILEVERERAKHDWAAAALIVEGLRSEEGARSLFQANPKLKAHFNSEIDFIGFAARWRPSLLPLPKEVPRSEEKNFGHRHGFGLGPTILSYKMPNGCWVTFQWNGPYDSPSRQLTNIECSQ